MNKRPAWEWALEGLALAATLSAVGLAIYFWPQLPERIPVHFGPRGNPNGWGGKHFLLILLGIQVGAYLLMCLTQKYPLLINLPIEVDRERPDVRRMLQSMVTVLKAVLGFVFLYLTWAMIQVAMGRSQKLSGLFLPVLLIGVLAPMGVYVKRLWRFRL